MGITARLSTADQQRLETSFCAGTGPSTDALIAQGESLLAKSGQILAQLDACIEAHDRSIDRHRAVAAEMRDVIATLR